MYVLCNLGNVLEEFTVFDCHVHLRINMWDKRTLYSFDHRSSIAVLTEEL